MTENVVK